MPLPRTARHRSWIAWGVVAFAAIIWHALPWAFPLPEALLVPRPVSPAYLARDGSPLRQLLDETGQRSAPEVSFFDLPPALIDATLAVEDQRFFHHDGIDYRAVLRATWDNLRAGRIVSGASTLPQQLVKISSPPQRRTLWRKFVEAQQARRLVREWPRTRILATWLNRVSFGNLLTGCQAASQGYFNKPLGDLTLAECALLAGLPQSPARLNPLRYPERAKARQRHVLARLLAENLIDAPAHQRADAQPLVYAPFHGGFAAPHAIDLLRQHSGAPSPASPLRTTLDARLQRRVEQVLTSRLAGLRDRHVTQAAAVVLDNATGDVLALAGSRDFFSPEGGQINGAWMAHSPGSALKPFTYLLALERGLTPATVIPDLPVVFPTPTGPYRPENYNGRCFGPVTLRDALGNSLNIPAVKTLESIGGAAVLLSTLQNLGLTTLTEPPEHYGLGLTLGNAPVRLLELATAYSTLARLGQHRPWRLLETDPAPPPVERFSATHTWLIADILSDNQARLLTFGPRSPLRLPFRVAVKTGTSSSYRDNWALGYTPQHTVAVWAGNFDRTPMQGVSGVTGAAPILADLFTELRDRFGPSSWFTPPAGIESARIDPRTGKVLTAQSPSVRLSRSEHFASGSLPPPATSTDYDSEGRALLSPEYADWITTRDNPLAGLVALASPEASPADPPRILQPLDGNVYHLDPDLPGGGRLLSLRASADTTGLAWTSPTLRLSRQGSRWTAELLPGTHVLHLHSAPNAPPAHSVRITVVQD